MVRKSLDFVMVEDARVCAGGDCMGNGIIFGAAMAEKRLETGEVRYSAAYPTGRERILNVLLYHGV